MRPPLRSGELANMRRGAVLLTFLTYSELARGGPEADAPAAQRTQSAGEYRHDGTLVRMSTGAGWGTVSARGSSVATRSDAEAGGTLQLGMSAMALGGGTAVFALPSHDFGSPLISAWSFSGFLEVYPRASSGLCVHVAPGLGIISVGGSDFLAEFVSGRIGYAFWVETQLSLGISGDVAYAHGSQAMESTPSIDFLVTTVSIALIYH